MPNNYLQSIKDAIGSLLGQPREGGDAVQMLMQDHRRVKQLFAEFEHKEDSNEKKEIATKILLELTVHAKIEEELVYPVLKREGEEDEVDEALVEHHIVKFLIGEIGQMKPSDDLFDAKVKVLGEMVDHHVQEEEHEMLPKLREGDTDTNELGQRMAQRKEQLLQQMEKQPSMLAGSNGKSTKASAAKDRSNGAGKTSHRSTGSRARSSAASSKKSASSRNGSKAKAAHGSKSAKTTRAAAKKSSTSKGKAGISSRTASTSARKSSPAKKSTAAKKFTPAKTGRASSSRSTAKKSSASSKGRSKSG